ncbi:hypothetical protein PMZ80_010427 [Knufia obscura]|uniref:Myb-like domain-containing protein n=1 Tax=Knufia obscura TaxID=1635080 RepID=A0ABR0R9Y2_9EURO|nr:hypothetical protein PMZ80_010427 [Knufia obscura]
MSTPPPPKRSKVGVPNTSSPPRSAELPPPSQVPVTPRSTLDTNPPSRPSTNPRKRAASRSPTSDIRHFDLKPPPATAIAESSSSASLSIPNLLSEDSAGKKPRSRTNTPWTAAEEQRLKQMRDTGNTWSEIAKVRLQPSHRVKKHWYKDMHYAEFAEDDTKALLEAIKEYDANKWKVIGQKLGKPAKACEQFAKDHFGKTT